MLLGTCLYNDKNLLLIDIPGTYSLMSNSQEEEIARNYICFGNPDTTVVILDATCMEKNLNLVFQILEITQKVVVCVNLLDEADKKGIKVDLDKLSKFLGVPVVGTTARIPKTLDNLLSKVCDVASGKIICHPKKIKYLPVIEDCILMLNPDVEKALPSSMSYLNRWICLKLIDNDPRILHSIEDTSLINISTQDINNKLIEVRKLLSKNDITENSLKDKLVSSIILTSEKICKNVISYTNSKNLLRDLKIDRILTSKKFGIPIMLLFLGIIFWITITGANYPSMLLSDLFYNVQEKLVDLFNYMHVPNFITGLLIDGMYQTVSWVIAVMLPPMAIFFPLFTILEDSGFLPRIAFNLDNFFKKACTTGKQALTMCMGFGCNAARCCWM